MKDDLNINTNVHTSKCEYGMKFEDCELAILRHAVDEGEIIQKKKNINPEMDAIFKILEEFIIKKKLILYGGLALNNMMPKEVRFYDEDIDVPDYDMFSENALEDAKELADIYYSLGYKEVEARSGMHYGTFKVFVDFVGVADITQIPSILYKKLNTDAVVISGMYYSPPDYLRMALYLELSRPAGDITRWEKVLKRLTLLNKYYPLQTPVNCEIIDFQRKMESITDINENEKIYFITRDFFIEKGVVFFGGYASSLYSKYMPKNEKTLLEKNPDFDVLSTDIDQYAMQLVETLKYNGYKNAKYKVNDAIGELIPRHIQIHIGIDIIAFIFEPIACHSYNVVKINKQNVNIATIDTMLSFYLAFIYIDKFRYIKERIMCMAKFLFDVQQKNRLEQRGLLKRFTMNCYGKQMSMKSIRAEKAEKYRELENKKGTKEYDMWFLKYTPSKKNNIQKDKNGKDEKDIVDAKEVDVTEDKINVNKGEEEIIEKEESLSKKSKDKTVKKRINKRKKRKQKTLKITKSSLEPKFSVFYK